MKILEAWREATGPEMVEPWITASRSARAGRRLATSFPDGDILAVDHRFYKDLGVDLDARRRLRHQDPPEQVAARVHGLPDARPLPAERGVDETIARVVGRYEDGGLSSLNELVHENGHAVHISAIRNRPAFTDWTDTIFTEAFADVPSWSVYEPAWQRKYLGHGNPSRHVAHRPARQRDAGHRLVAVRDPHAADPAQDPNALWTDITREYLHIKPHPEVAWWAVRVQLVSRPGYMINFGLGSILTAEMRKATTDAFGPFDAGNPRWHEWTSEKLIRFGSEKSAKQLMTSCLPAPVPRRAPRPKSAAFNDLSQGDVHLASESKLNVPLNDSAPPCPSVDETACPLELRGFAFSFAFAERPGATVSADRFPA